MENTKKLRAKVAQDDKHQTEDVFLLVKTLKVASWQLQEIAVNPPRFLMHQFKLRFQTIRKGIDLFLGLIDNATSNTQEVKDFKERHEDFTWKVLQAVRDIPLEMQDDFIATLAEAVEIYAEAALKIKAKSSDKEVGNE
jgi:hypothetical protein